MFDGLKPPPSPFEAPTLAHRIFSSPLRFIAQQLYAFQILLRNRSYKWNWRHHPIRVLCISDTHCHEPDLLPSADVLIHAGDLTNDGTVCEISKQLRWLETLDEYKYKIVICGNHDSFFDPRSRRVEDTDKNIDWGSKESAIYYLQHSSVTLRFEDHGSREIKVYGAPQIPGCGGSEFAFQYPRGQDAWLGTVPDDTDILVTHTPPKFHLDLPRGMGCEWLLQECWRIKPLLHAFGHVHCGHGSEVAFWDEGQKHYENLLARRRTGPMWTFFNIFAWLDIVKMMIHSAIRVMWSTVWGGNEESTILVNSALMVGSTGKLGNKPQVVEI